MEWLDVVYGAVGGGGLLKVLDKIVDGVRSSRKDRISQVLEAEGAMRKELREENDDLRERNVQLETERRECLHKLGNHQSTINLLTWKLEQLGEVIEHKKEQET